MADIKHILVASDLTDGSHRALVRAVQLKQATAAALTLLHVAEPGLAEELAESRRSAALAALRSHMTQASQEELRRVVIEVLTGTPAATILGEAEAQGTDLIVLGEPRKQRMKELFVGTTAERVIRQSERPVLVVKGQPDKAYQRVLVAFDLSQAAERVLDTTLALAPLAEFRLVHARRNSSGRVPEGMEEKGANERARSLLEDAARRAGARSAYPHTKLAVDMVEGPPAAVIANTAAAFGADLLAMGTHGRGRVRTALFGSVAQELVATSSCDVLVTRP
jgi:nucleotide-binding universal stress UspA family protein